ncbi:MAG: secretin N-terminal domain-containing protein [Gammaproteobacteria bacterium]|nr:secretin N-terminal domain-containing protein [Gammaproteobacteria bacterium]MBU1645900.1 secretin N-terminal domain-containing protein [Gammaproteobacteria bacterium]MBU1971962.1 secretin N-terminal domain-containing protein [Gammaproteobacteria bacterium]
MTQPRNLWRGALAGCLAAMLLAGCASKSARPPGQVLGDIDEAMLQASTDRKVPQAPLDAALMPALQPEFVVEQTKEKPFDLSVVNAPAGQVFMALVTGTSYSMLLAPDLSGNITVNLKNVTVLDALDTIRELYGYEYKLQGQRIFIEPNTIKTRVFQVNYLASRRQGSSDLRVTGSSIATSGASSSGTSTPTTTSPASGSAAGSGGASSDTSRVSMTTDSDFWGDLQRALTAIVGNADGRSVVVNPSSGVLVVRALPGELRNVEKYLKATQLVADRQVMLEAKIIDVTLNESFQAGINWAVFKSGPNSHTGAGVVAPGTTLAPSTPATGATTTLLGSAASPTLSVLPGLAGAVTGASLGQGLVGLAFQTSNFSTLLNFLESQGNVAVLSSPRIATLNNQKAVLKVGTDEMFVTNVTTSTTTTATGSVATPSVTLQPYFSGISLDVTPQIDDEGNVVLHVHPAVSTVAEKEKIIDLGALGVYKLPLATSSINETDSIVRVQDSNIVAIGGLMRQEQTSDRNGLPGTSNLPLFGQRGSSFKKRELVILIKPTIIRDDRAWAQDIKDAAERVRGLRSEMAPPAQ